MSVATLTTISVYKTLLNVPPKLIEVGCVKFIDWVGAPIILVFVTFEDANIDCRQFSQTTFSRSVGWIALMGLAVWLIWLVAKFALSKRAEARAAEAQAAAEAQSVAEAKVAHRISAILATEHGNEISGANFPKRWRERFNEDLHTGGMKLKTFLKKYEEDGICNFNDRAINGGPLLLFVHINTWNFAAKLATFLARGREIPGALFAAQWRERFNEDLNLGGVKLKHYLKEFEEAGLCYLEWRQQFRGGPLFFVTERSRRHGEFANRP
jgi:hypothetical protein